MIPLVRDRFIPGDRVFITGGTGFIGLWIVKMLLALSARRRLSLELVLLTRNPHGFALKHPDVAAQVVLVTGDIQSFDFPKGDFSAVIHAATETNAAANEAHPALLFDSIVQGTHRVLAFAQGCGCKKMLYVSSGAVYGHQPRHLERLEESYIGGVDVTDVTGYSAYAEGKRAAEFLCASRVKSAPFDVVIARLFSFLGPHIPLDGHFAMGNFIRDALAGRDIVVKGDGTTVRSYMYGADMAYWLLTLLFEGQAGRAYNVGSPVPVSIAELAQMISALSGGASRVVVCQKKQEGVLPLRYVPDVTRATSELELLLRNPLNEAILKTLRWCKNEISL